jgi:hypothetical protein
VFPSCRSRAITKAIEKTLIVASYLNYSENTVLFKNV